MDDKEDNYTIKQQIVKSNVGLLELLNISFLIFKSQFKTFFIIVLLLGIPLNMLEIWYPMPTVNFSELETVQINKNVAIVFAHLILNIVMSSLQIAAAVFIVKKTIQNRHVDASRAMLFSIKRSPKVLITYTILTLLVLLGLILFIIPGIVVYILFMMSLYVSADRLEYGMSAFKYTFGLVKRNTLKVAMTLIFTTSLQMSFAVIFGSYILNNDDVAIGYSIFYYLATYILTGYITTVSAVLYFHFNFNYGHLINKRK